MRLLPQCLLLAWSTAAFLGVAGCSHRSAAAATETTYSASANAAQKETKKTEAPVPTAATTAPVSASSSRSATSSSSSTPASSPPGPAKSTTPDARLALALKQLGAQQSPRGEVLRLPKVRFGPGQPQFEDGSATDIGQVVALLHDYPSVLLIVDGYTDNRGSERLNDRLSLQRANSVQQALVADGLNATRIRTRGLGSTDPIADNGTREGRDKNRRVQLVFSNSAGTFASAADQITAG